MPDKPQLLEQGRDRVKLFADPSEDFQLFGWLQLLDLILDFFCTHPRFASSFLA